MSAADHLRIGSTGLRVPRLGVGAATLGDVFGAVPESAAEELLATALATGITYVDTAPLYGNGLSETRLGSALRALGNPELTISTKVGRLLDDSDDGWHFDFSADGIRRSLESSLERLGRDRVDIVYLHDPVHFEQQIYEESLPALEQLRAEGVVRAIGVGMNQWQLPLRLVERTSIDVVMVAGRYTLLDQSAADRLLPACLERGVAVAAAGIFNSGILVDPVPGAWYDYTPASAELLSRATRMRNLLAEFDVTLPRAALNFSAAHPAVTTCVVGVGSAEMLRANAAALGAPVPEEAWAALRAAGLLV